MGNSDLEIQVQSLLVVFEAVAFLGLAGFCAARLDRSWAGLGLAGGLLMGITIGISAVASFESVFLDSSRIAEAVYTHDHVSLVLTVATALGTALVVMAFVQAVRSTDGLAGR